METTQGQNTGKPTGAHWTQNPWKLLAGALAALLVTYLVQLAAPLASSSLNQVPMQWLSYALVPIIPLLFASAFYFPVRAAQRRQGVDVKANWRPGVVFLIGLGLLLAYVWFITKPTGQWFDIPTIAMQFLYAAANGLSMLLLYHLLAPSFEKRMGLQKGALALGAGFAVLAVLEQISVNIISGIYNVIYMQMRLPAQNTPSILSVFLPGTLLPLCVSAFALAAVRVALYQRASRNMPGTWMLFSSIPLLLSIACSAILRALSGGKDAPLWLNLTVRLPFYLIIFAVCLALIRWKTFGAFRQDAKLFVKKTQGDINE